MLIFFLYLLQIALVVLQGALFEPLPTSDTGNVRHSSIPFMTVLLIVINSLVFILFTASNLYQGLNALDAGDRIGIDRFYHYELTNWMYGYRSIFMREGVGIGAFSTFTSMFMHGDFWHLFFNMIYLWTFGRRVEDACGPWRYLLFYLAAGMIAHIGATVLNPAQVDLPEIGASGAIAGVMGAYLILFPGAMVTCLWGIGIVLRVPVVIVLKIAGVARVADAKIWRWTIRLPAWILLIYFLVQEALPSLEVIQHGKTGGGVSNLAHVTGFLAALVIFLFVRKDLVTRYFSGRAI
jgi:membrane associated rhomboid family serine protease